MTRRFSPYIVLAILAVPSLCTAAEDDPKSKLLAAGVEEIVFATRTIPPDGHWYANFGYFFDGPKSSCFGVRGSLRKLNVASGQVEVIFEDPEGGIRDPQLHYDGQEILFAYRKGGEAQYHLYTINVDGSDLTQLTDGVYDDMEPCYLPDGGIVFVSARSKRWVQCWVTQVATLYRCDADGGNIQRLSSNIEQDNTPWVLPDGRILFTRWEYVDRSQVRFHHLWTCNPDGGNPAVFFGNMRPDNVFIDAKPIVGADGDIVFIASPGHGRAEHAGAVTRVSGRRGPDDIVSFQPISRVKPEGYRDPISINADCFLATHENKLIVMDAAGKESVLLEAELNIHEPRPVIARPRERVIPSRVMPREETGTVFLADVYRGRNMKGIAPGEIKSLLILETLPKPLNHGQSLHDFIPISHGGTFTLERILGSVPVEEDGSAHFEIPANRPVFFIAVDENNSSVKRMHSFMSVMPGETIGCVGCHEHRAVTPDREMTAGLEALSRRASKITPVPGVPYMHDYPRDIQPILDRHCVECHQPDQPDGRVLLTGDHGGIFSVSYFTLISRRLISDGRNGVGNSAPRSVGDCSSKLMTMLDGSHHDARLSAEEIEMIRGWIHIGAPYAGTYAALGTGLLFQTLPLPPGHEPIRQAAQKAFVRRCASCHPGQFPQVNRYTIASGGGEGFLDSHFAFNLTRPDKSPLLLAPLASDAGGWAMCRQNDGSSIEVFGDTSHADYQALLAYAEFGKTALEQNKRWDMPGFKPNRHYVREMKRFGILPESFDVARDPIDVHAIDRAYWESFWHTPDGATTLHANETLHKLMVPAGADYAWETDITTVEPRQ